MTSDNFINECKYRIACKHNNKVDTLKGEDNFIQYNNIHCVWFNKSLQNYKGLFIILPLDGKYYECTYNGNTNELYIDTYLKEENECINLDNKYKTLPAKPEEELFIEKIKI